MAFGASRRIWGRRLLPEVQRNLAAIGNTISEFEPVSMLVRPAEMSLARRLVGDSVELVEAPLDDLWIRDTGPIFVLNAEGAKAAVDFNFNGWGNKQAHSNDAKVAGIVAAEAGVPLLETTLVLEGGCIEVDGEGTAIIAESCVLNMNRNPKVSKAEFEALLKNLIGLTKIIWLPGIRGKDITDGHTDFYARFVRPGVVVAGLDPDPNSYDHEVTKQNIEILSSASDSKGNALQVVALTGPTEIRPRLDTSDFAAGYVGFYVCNGVVVAQHFGDEEADEKAEQSLQKAFPDREVIQIAVDGIAAGGGSIHCATQQEPK